MPGVGRLVVMRRERGVVDKEEGYGSARSQIILENREKKLIAISAC